MENPPKFEIHLEDSPAAAKIICDGKDITKFIHEIKFSQSAHGPIHLELVANIGSRIELTAAVFPHIYDHDSALDLLKESFKENTGSEIQNPAKKESD